jgi:hypothetical protein
MEVRPHQFYFQQVEVDGHIHVLAALLKGKDRPISSGYEVPRTSLGNVDRRKPP